MQTSGSALVMLLDLLCVVGYTFNGIEKTHQEEYQMAEAFEVSIPVIEEPGHIANPCGIDVEAQT